jgi:hypothetical protein
MNSQTRDCQDNTSSNNTQDPSLIERCPHDKKNPYVMVSKDILKNKSLSMAARCLLVYFLSLPDDWKINPCHVTEVMGINRKTTYKYLNELIEQGYCTRIEKKIKGRFGGVKYRIREYPIKETTPHPKKRETEKPCPKKPHPKKRDYTNTEDTKDRMIDMIDSPEGEGKKSEEKIYFRPSDKTKAIASITVLELFEKLREKGYHDSEIQPHIEKLKQTKKPITNIILYAEQIILNQRKKEHADSRRNNTKHSNQSNSKKRPIYADEGLFQAPPL